MIVISQEADLTSVFIISGCAGVAILIVTIVVIVYLKNERQTNKVAMQERNTGVAMWGTRNPGLSNTSQETITDERGGTAGSAMTRGEMGSRQSSNANLATVDHERETNIMKAINGKQFDF